MWIASWTSWRSARSSAQRICSGPAPTSSWIFSPPPPARSASLDRAGARRGRAHQQHGVDGVGLERRPGRGEPLGGVVAEVPDGPVVLDHERRQAARERGVRDLRREPVHVRVDAAGRDDHAGRVDRRRCRCRARPRSRPSCRGCRRGRSRRCARPRSRGWCAGRPARGPRRARRRSPAPRRRARRARRGRRASCCRSRAGSGRARRRRRTRARARGRSRRAGRRRAQAPRYPRSRAGPARPRARPSASSGPSARPAWPRITRAPPNGCRNDLARHSRVEEDLRAGSDREPHAPGGGALEAQRAVDLEEVEVRRDADRHLALVDDRQRGVARQPLDRRPRRAAAGRPRRSGRAGRAAGCRRRTAPPPPRGGRARPRPRPRRPVRAPRSRRPRPPRRSARRGRPRRPRRRSARPPRPG